MFNISKINIIGSGRVASSIGMALNDHFDILGLYSRNRDHATTLSKQLGCVVVNDINELSSDSHLNVIAVSDDSIRSVVEKLPKNTATVHTSGSIGIDVFEDFINCGVIYPLQTFSTQKFTRLKEVPFLLEANNSDFFSALESLVLQKIQGRVYKFNSRQRSAVHLAAVFANNFTNHMLSVSEKILGTENIDFDILKPLVQETVEKAFSEGTFQSQTGPAKRNDKNVIRIQGDSLSGYEHDIYKLITDAILRRFNS